MKVNCTYAARMMLVLLCACLTWGASTTYAQDDCCDRILDLQVTKANERCCYIVSGKVALDSKCFRSWLIQENINGSWVNVSPSLGFNRDGSFSYTLCQGVGTHSIRVLFVNYDGNVICRRSLEYTCREESECCDLIRGPTIEQTYSSEDKCCYKIYGTVTAEGVAKCFRYWELQTWEDGQWVSLSAVGFAEDGSFGIEHCVRTGIHQMRILFYDHNGEVMCIRDFTLNCEHPCCELIRGPYIYPDASTRECCFTIKGSVGERGLECFRYWDFEVYKDGQWVNDGSFGFDGDGTFSIYKCMPFGLHKMRIVFYDYNGRPICIKELEYNCEHPCCDLIRGPFITPAPVSSHDLCCFKLYGSVGDQGLNCFKWWEFEYLVDGAWVNDGVKYPFDASGGFEIIKCLPAGTHQIRILFSDGNGIICIKETEYTCENNCCETIDGPYIGPGRIRPQPGYCCFTISGKVGENNPCFKFIQLEFLQNGVWVNDGTEYYFNPDGSFVINQCLPTGTHQIRVLFYNSDGKLLCRRELTYTCEERCCETIKGPFIYPAAIDPRPGVCCFTVSGSVGENNPCFKYWEYEYFVNGQWVNDGQYGFNPDGSFSVTKCVRPGTYPILIKFYNSNKELVCTKRLEFTCDSDCCETIRGPFIGPSPIDPPPGMCCFTVSGAISDRSPCFTGWQYEEFINGVWVNDLVTYPFNPDGSFSIIKCRPYGTHLIRILFIDQNGEVICKKRLEYTCEGNCCETINGPFIYPATDADVARCCFTIRGSVGEGNPCFKYWEYVELINGVWVNDLVQYPFNPDGSFSITKCRPYGTHQILILFYDGDGKLICKRGLEYTCEPPCCNTIQGPNIFPARIQPTDEAEDAIALRCCFTIKGSVGECNRCFKYWEYEELINGQWVNDGVSYTFNADGSFSITKCRPYGTHHIRILFYDYNGRVICVRELNYTCRYNPRCCETIQGPYIRTILSEPDRCCFAVNGTVGPDNPCFASYEIEQFIDGVWVNDRVSYVFNPDGSFGVRKCVRPGSHLFRILFRSADGEVRCIKEFKYNCENRCCETIQGPFLETYYTTPDKCCFRIFGSIGRRNPCFSSFEFERLVRGRWINDGVSYLFDADGNYELRKCVPAGTHQMRLVFRDANGEPICIKEFEYTCDYNDCCETIRGPEVTPLPSSSDVECCFLISGSVGADNRCFQSYEFEELIDGRWVNDRVSYTFNRDGSFQLRKCLPAGSHTMRLIFRGYDGSILCIKDFEYSCEHPCCKTISGPYISPDQSTRRCCFKIYGKADPNCFQGFEFEVFQDGRWVNDGVSYIINADGSFSIYKCLPRGTIYLMRLLFRDPRTGKVICIREFTYGCLEAEDEAEALKGSERSVSGGVVQRLSSVPNPASDQMTISYQLTQETPVRLSLFSHIGQEVLVLDQGTKTAGLQSLPVNTSNLASGVYIVRLMVDGKAIDLPVTIVK